MAHKVSIRQFDCAIDVKDGQSILDAALKAGLDYPYACRSGTCSACKTELLSGDVKHRAYDALALSEIERAAGIILACRASPVSNCEVAFLEDDALEYTPRKVECRISHIEHATHDIAVVRAVARDGTALQFAAGQFAMLTLPGLPPREYSFASRPGSLELEFHVRSRQGGHVSSHIFERSRVGDHFLLNGPFGNAYLRKEHSGPIILVVGGTGLAPAMSILRECLATLPGREIKLFFSVRQEGDLYFGELLRRMSEEHSNFTFYPVIYDPVSGYAQYRGNVLEFMENISLNFRSAKVYTCGPPGLVSACQRFVTRMGTLPENCHADSFVSQEEKIAS
ncbi:2Fe-2S iron-sulfur cluster binding domain-containing protein [Pseudaminobacter sp. 19-2017]|uniref:2Fe-2S iron-sulfur cluster binding domain-containing protein n=1 Tax=Pseudaminobacter soli (ex Zhang et al. 2022) TaxID=2831468 RepID=A0A942E716_9HYPH|nr:2Fe-2S iron-sulfur cluster-binding protein [Pseudaminobacter soli]MBS3651660.1 2Fe-2S iron-sulfur cluster binding domain-containing protein [Pseudaminobacter soli]